MKKSQIFLQKVLNKRNPKHLNDEGFLLYDYSKVDYKNNCTNIEIICSVHGSFYQQPANHLKGSGCPECSTTGLMSNSAFIERCNSLHNNKYDYFKTKYTGSRNEVLITCKEHGDFSQRASTHLQGSGCSHCAGNSNYSNEEFIERCRRIHNNKYNYSLVKYKNTESEVLINCKYHGEFSQNAGSHLLGKGCPLCGILNRGWTNKSFENACNRNNRGLAMLYVLKIYNDDEMFYKVGKTSRSVKERFDKSNLPYDYDTLFCIEGEPSRVSELERIILREKRGSQYMPTKTFGGSTECLSDILGIESYLCLL